MTFLILLRPAPHLSTPAAWTAEDNAAVGAHFAYLTAARDAGQLVLAGRTDEPSDRTFGIVVFSADDTAAAQRFLDGDPAVAAGVMTATLHPYRIALQGLSNGGEK